MLSTSVALRVPPLDPFLRRNKNRGVCQAPSSIIIITTTTTHARATGSPLDGLPEGRGHLRVLKMAALQDESLRRGGADDEVVAYGDGGRNEAAGTQRGPAASLKDTR